MIFKKKKILGNYNMARVIFNIPLPLEPFEDKITSSNIVLITIDRVCTKIKTKYIKRTTDGIER